MATTPTQELVVPLIGTAPPFRPGATPPLQAVVELNVRDRSGGLVALKFVVDSGAGITSIPWATAISWGIPIGTTRVTSRHVTFQGPVLVSTWRHRIEVEFVALPGRWFVFDCQFPDVPPTVPGILGIGGDVLRFLTITLDGVPQPPHARYGCVRISIVDPPHSPSP